MVQNEPNFPAGGSDGRDQSCETKPIRPQRPVGTGQSCGTKPIRGGAGAMRPGDMDQGQLYKQTQFWSARRPDGCHREQTKPISPGGQGPHGSIVRNKAIAAVPGGMRLAGRGPGPVCTNKPNLERRPLGRASSEQTKPISHSGGVGTGSIGAKQQANSWPRQVDDGPGTWTRPVVQNKPIWSAAAQTGCHREQDKANSPGGQGPLRGQSCETKPIRGGAGWYAAAGRGPGPVVQQT